MDIKVVRRLENLTKNLEIPVSILNFNSLNTLENKIYNLLIKAPKRRICFKIIESTLLNIPVGEINEALKELKNKGKIEIDNKNLPEHLKEFGPLISLKTLI